MLGVNDVRSQKLAKIAIAKTNNVNVNITGIAGDTISKLSSLGQSLGVTYSGNSVIKNNTALDLSAVQRHGVISGMGITINSNPQYFDVASGVYYVNGSRIEYTGDTIDTSSVSGGEFASIIIDNNRNVSLKIGEFPSVAEVSGIYLELGAFSKTDANTINKIGSSAFVLLDFFKKLHIRQKMFEGTKFDGDAAKISMDGLTVDIAGGYINTPNADVAVLSSETNISGQLIHRVGGVYQINSETVLNLNNTQYDNGDLTTLSNNNYVVHTIARSSRTDTIYVIIGTEQFNKLKDAIEADYNLGIFAGVSGSEIEPLANVIIEKDAIEASAVIDLRGRVKVTTSSLAALYDSKLSALEARIEALEGA